MTNSAGEGADQEGSVHGALMGDHSWKYEAVLLASASGAVVVDGCPAVANDEPVEGRGSR